MIGARSLLDARSLKFRAGRNLGPGEIRGAALPRRECDILVAGGGLAGLLATAAFGSAGYDVICIDRRSERSETAETMADTRSTALLLPAKSVLSLAGIWPEIDKESIPLRCMKIIDANGDCEINSVVEFESSEIGREKFGWNISNKYLRGLLKDRISGLSNVSVLQGRLVNRVLNRDLEAIAEYSGGNRIAAKLVLAADGRNSAIRESLGIKVIGRDARQTALAFSVLHQFPHGDTSVEIHDSGGPFTLIPLPDLNGGPASAVVWIEASEAAKDIPSLPKCEFNAKITKRSCSIFGQLKLVSDIGAWPVLSQLANRFAEGRTALIAECAHVLPPIGAQGLNLSIGDIASLYALLENSDLENRDFADRLAFDARARRFAAFKRYIGVEALNLASSWESNAMRRIRTRGLEAVGGIGAVRKPLMRSGIGSEFDIVH
ncbi:MAG: FAD-dependent monooxygenase [Albidovulum sp.]|nr:FAD-dependent monooxygenase [Albidovulum sp.]